MLLCNKLLNCQSKIVYLSASANVQPCVFQKTLFGPCSKLIYHKSQVTNFKDNITCMSLPYIETICFFSD